MAKFEMIKNPGLPIGSHSDANGQTWSKPGSIVESDKPLHKLFPDRFKKAAANAKLTDPDVRPEVLAMEEDNEDMPEAEVHESPPKPANTPEADAAKKTKDEKKKPVPAKTKAPAKVEEDEDEDEDDSEEEEEEEEEEAPAKDEGEDVTKSFKAAKDNDLTVHRVAKGANKGFHVKEDGKALHPKPLANKAAVDKFLADREDEE